MKPKLAPDVVPYRQPAAYSQLLLRPCSAFSRQWNVLSDGRIGPLSRCSLWYKSAGNGTSLPDSTLWLFAHIIFSVTTFGRDQYKKYLKDQNHRTLWNMGANNPAKPCIRASTLILD
jgi:hypothetical protein